MCCRTYYYYAHSFHSVQFSDQRPEESYFKGKDSSVKKNSAFIKKLVCTGLNLLASCSVGSMHSFTYITG